MSSTITLYRLEGCPYCAKVETKLEKLGLEYDARDVPRSRDDRSEVKAISDQAGVPVLVDPDHGVGGMPESDDIVAYLERQYA